jgi:Ser/Thr protein kinase RdoA (MazF antagonist)
VGSEYEVRRESEHESEWPPNSRLLSSIADAYGLVSLVPLESRATWGGHLRGRLQDKQGHVYLIKERSPELTPELFEAHLKLHRHVESFGGPVAHLIPSSGGATHVTIDNRQFELQAFCAGSSGHLAVGEVRSAGRALARFLGIASTFGAWPVGDWSVPRDRSSRLPDRWEWIVPYLRHLAVDPVSGSLVSELVSAIISAQHAPDSWHSLPAQMIHGDVHPVNFVASGDSTILVDLDEARFGYRLWDIAHAAAAIGCIQTSGRENDVRESWDVTRLGSFVAGLSDFMSLSQSENVLMRGVLASATAVVVIEDLDYDVTAPTANQAREVLARLIGLMRTLPAVP